MKKYICLAMSFVIAFLLCGCVGLVIKEDKEFEKIRIENSLYINDYFQFSMKIPEGWTVLDKYISNKLMEWGAGQAGITPSHDFGSLLMVIEKPLGTKIDFNSSIIITWDDLRSNPDVKNGSHCLEELKTSLLNDPSTTIVEDIHPQYIDSREFGVLATAVKIKDETINQIYHTIMINGYAICFLISYKNPDQKQKLMNMIQSINFTYNGLTEV